MGAHNISWNNVKHIEADHICIRSHVESIFTQAIRNFLIKTTKSNSRKDRCADWRFTIALNVTAFRDSVGFWCKGVLLSIFQYSFFFPYCPPAKLSNFFKSWIRFHFVTFSGCICGIFTILWRISMKIVSANSSLHCFWIRYAMFLSTHHPFTEHRECFT